MTCLPHIRLSRRTFAGLLLALAASAAAQTPHPAALPGINHAAGTDAPSGIVWTRISLPAQGLAGDPASWPMLTVQCSQNGPKRGLDLFFDFGGADRGFHPPPPPDPVTHRPPWNQSLTLKLDFQGYHPFKRQFEEMPSGEYRYRTPGMGSSNLEPVTFFLQYMYAVPVLRISYTDHKRGSQVAEFHTSGLVDQVRKTDLCR